MRRAYKGKLYEDGVEYNIVVKSPKQEKKYREEVFFQVKVFPLNKEIYYVKRMLKHKRLRRCLRPNIIRESRQS